MIKRIIRFLTEDFFHLREEEVENWAHCIETRGIELPAEIKDEILMMLQ